MAERPFTPPTRKPVSEFPTPDPSVAFYTELVNRDDPAYMANAPVKRGQLYANMVGAKREVIDTYPNLFFLRERKFQLSDQQVLWDWATDENAENTYNAEVTYIANAVTYPAITRTYTVRRELWEADPIAQIGSPLPGIIAVEITSPGKNHTTARGVIDDTDAAIEFTVDATGGLMNGIITNTGSTLIQNGTSITIIGDGQDSSAIAVSQPIGCVLTAQKKEELQDADPQQHEFVRVTRVYETLPGPWIYSTRIDKDGMIVTLKTRRQVADFITDSDEVLGGEWIQTWHKGTDNFVAEENVESRSVPGNNIVSTKIEEDGKVMTIVKTLVECSTIVSEETLSGGIWSKVRKEEIASTTFVKDTQASNLVCWQIVEARAVPGNPLVDTRVEEDGMVTTITKILGDASAIVSGEVISSGFWIKTHEEEVSDLVAYQVQEVRPIPGNPLVTTRIEEDGMVTTISKILGDTSLIVSSEVLSGGFWVKTFKEEVSDLVAFQIQESRPIPGNTVETTRLDEDGRVVHIHTTLRQASVITNEETVVAGLWRKVTQKYVSDIVGQEIVETRVLPGNPIPSAEVDKDGVTIDVVRTLKESATITISEAIVGGVWTRTSQQDVTDLVSWEKVTAREVPGNPIPSANVGADYEVATVSTVIRDKSTITPSASESGGIITTVEQKEVTDLVSEEVTTVKEWLDEASYSISITNLIPREFMAFIPTYTESHIYSGTAAMPTLALGEFEHSQKQMTRLLYEDRITSLGSISLPITHTNQELTELYGGGVLNVNLTLDTTGSQTIDSGLLVTRSTLTDLGNGMVVKETAQLDGLAWPTNTGTLFDQDMQIEYPVEEQVVDPSYVVTTGAFILETLEPIDDWRSQRKKVTKTPVNTDSASSIVTTKYHPFRFPGLLTFILFGYYVRASDSQLCKHTIRTWWENNVSTPVIAVDEIVMDDPIISTLNDVTVLAYSGPCLHDDFTTFGVLFWPATTPSVSDYIATWQNNEKIIAATVDKTDIPNLWKIQTISVVMR
jgi:uncharacterized protein YebE (UPF0316 family)